MNCVTLVLYILSCVCVFAWSFLCF